jgi:diguanylate cyclase (GGDEF)-like protein
MNPDLLSRIPDILYRIGKVFGSDKSLSVTLSNISELVTELSGADACSIMLADSERKLLLGKAAYGLLRADFSEVSFRYGEGIAGWVAQNSLSALVTDVTKDERYKTLTDSASKIRSLAAVPMVSRDTVVGVVTITAAKPNVFTSSSVDLLQLIANTMAMDIENIRLRRLSVTDKLTGAYNREFLSTQLPALMQEAQQERKPLSIAMFDVDHFKRVNDTHGHDTGDKVLTEIAHRLREANRAGDMLVRYGGEEFLLLLPSASVESAAEIANRVRVQLQDRVIEVGDLKLDIRISAGVAEYRHPESPSDLFRRADAALYSAKDGGRNRVEVAP